MVVNFPEVVSMYQQKNVSIYINDLWNSATNAEFVLFADDTNIFVNAKSENDVY